MAMWDLNVLDSLDHEDKVLVKELYKAKKEGELLKFLKSKGVVTGGCGSCLAKTLPDWIEYAKYYKLI